MLEAIRTYSLQQLWIGLLLVCFRLFLLFFCIPTGYKNKQNFFLLLLIFIIWQKKFIHQQLAIIQYDSRCMNKVLWGI